MKRTRLADSLNQWRFVCETSVAFSFIVISISMCNIACAEKNLISAKANSKTLELNADDSPQWRGPLRDGHAAKQKLLASWPEGGPTLAWVYKDAGAGYSAASIVGGRLFTMGQNDKSCDVICIDVATGKEIWKTAVDRASKDDDYLHGWGGGPRATPTIHNNRVYTMSDLGKLACVDAVSGELIWTKDLVKEFSVGIPKWGFSESPLIDGDRVLATPGGSNFIVGFKLDDGAPIYRTNGYSANAHYVSIQKSKIANRNVYVTASQDGLVGFDVDSGEMLFANKSTGNGVAVIPTPVISGDKIYHTSAYGAGCVLINVVADGSQLRADQVYHEKTKSMENHHGGVVLVDETIYGFSKMDDGVWMAQDLETGKVLWTKKVGRNSSGSIAEADGKLYCYSDKDGSCHLVTPNRDDWQSEGVLELKEQTSLNRDKGAIWAHPVIAEQKLFIRDQDLIYAYDIAAQ